MKELLKLIRRDFDLKNPNTTFVEVNKNIKYVQDTYIHDASDLLRILVYVNYDKEIQLVFSN